jgi:uncharacterized membrane-anchored protein YitT (DUF2179 family)
LFFYVIPILGLFITAFGLVLLFVPRNRKSGTTSGIT